MGKAKKETAYRVLEFRPRFTSEQIDHLDKCLEPLRQLWNVSLSELEEFDCAKVKDKVSGRYVDRSLLPWDRRSVYVEGNRILSSGEVKQRSSEINKAVAVNGWEESPSGIIWCRDGKPLKAKEVEGKIIRYFAPCSSILAGKSMWLVNKALTVSTYTTVEGWKKAGKGICTASDLTHVRGWQSEAGLTFYSCPVSFHRREFFFRTPNLTGKVEGSDSFSRMAARETLAELIAMGRLDPAIMQVHSDYCYGVVKGLATAWGEYDKSRKGWSKSSVRRGKPRYKKMSDTYKTLSSGKSGGFSIKGKDLMQLPGVGRAIVGGVSSRWPENAPMKTFKITKRTGGYYLQITGEITKSLRQLKTEKVAAVDPGLRSWLTFDDGRTVDNPRFYQKSEEKLAKLQQQLSAKLTQNLILWLNHPDRTIADILSRCRTLKEESAKAVLSAKTESAIAEIIGLSYLGKLKWSVGVSKRTEALQKKISRLHEKVGNQRKHFIQKQSTWHVRKYGTLICEDGMQSPNLKAKAKPVVNEDKSGFKHNNASAKSGLSKSLSDTGYGLYLSLVEAKAKAAGKQLIKHPARFTTQQCPICDKKNKILLSETWYQCPQCGFEANRDQKAAIAMVVAVYEKGAVAWEDLSESAKSAIGQRKQWKNGNQ